MAILRRREKSEGDAKYKDARRQVDLALSRMAKALDQVQIQAAIAKEELDERRAG